MKKLAVLLLFCAVLCLTPALEALPGAASCAAVLQRVREGAGVPAADLPADSAAAYLDIDPLLLRDSAMARGGSNQIVVLTAKDAPSFKLLQAALSSYAEQSVRESPGLGPQATLRMRGMQLALVLFRDAAAASGALDGAWE